MYSKLEHIVGGSIHQKLQRITQQRRTVMIRDFFADVVNFFIGLLDEFLGFFGVDI